MDRAPGATGPAVRRPPRPGGGARRFVAAEWPARCGCRGGCMGRSGRRAMAHGGGPPAGGCRRRV